MAKCQFCGQTTEKGKLFRHQWKEHREDMLALRANRPRKKPPKKPLEGPAETTATGRKMTLSPMSAALVQFATQTMVVPMTPSLLYGFLCAKKFGFKGDLAIFLQEVIDDFYHRRGTNYFEEVMGWNEIGTVIGQEEAPLQASGQPETPPIGTAPR